MVKWLCVPCGWVYDEDEGYPDENIDPGTNFSELSSNFICPICGAPKEDFEML